MPELPEVETVVRGLREMAVDRRIARVAHASPHLLEREPRLKSLAGEMFVGFSRRGKYIIADLQSGRRLLIHLRMSGRLLVKDKHERRDKHDHLVLTFADCSEKLIFRDVRKFGIVQFLQGNDHPNLKALGPEAPAITAAGLSAILSRSSRPIKSLLLDQTRIAGLGNIYVDESLHRAGIHPCQPAATIGREQTAGLVRAIRHILRLAIKRMGTTFDSYRAADGSTGQYAGYLKVYNNDGGNCDMCGGPIEKIRVGGRGTHFCPRCQRLEARAAPRQKPRPKKLNKALDTT